MRLNSSKITLNFVVALQSEARPLIEHYGLRAQGRHGTLRYYEGDSVHLAISGIGATAVAGAVGFLGALSRGDAAVWLNVGIAGHHNAAIGECFLVDKLIAHQPSQASYPSISFPSRLPSSTLRTVSVAETDYPDECLYDMEGAIFFDAAKRFSPIELIALLKIVSDNRNHPIEKIDRALIHRLVSDAVPDITRAAGVICELASNHVAHTDYSEIAASASWRATESQKHQIIDLCRRLSNLYRDVDLAQLLGQSDNARQAIALLEDRVKKTPLRFEKLS